MTNTEKENRACMVKQKMLGENAREMTTAAAERHALIMFTELHPLVGLHQSCKI